MPHTFQGMVNHVITLFYNGGRPFDIDVEEN